MTAPRLPLGEGDVPDKALEELLAAFAKDAMPAPEIELDDPSIDQLLGLTPPPGSVELVTQPVDQIDGASVTAPVAALPLPPDEADSITAITPKTAEVADDKPAARKTIRIGGGDQDDLPDAVYLDEEAEERLRGTSPRSTEASIRSERTTILIGDDEIEGSSGGIPTGSTRGMDPRLRARRIAVRRAMSRRRLKWFVIVGVIVVFGTAALAVLGSSLFAVQSKHIVISGAARIDQTDLDAAVKQLAGHPELLIDTHKIEVELERSPWVRSARVTTHFPHTATIEILERTPLATYVGSDNRFRIIDDQGVVVDVLRGRPVEFMLVTGAGVNAEAGGSAGASFAHAAQLVEALTPGVRSRTASVTVGTTGELSLVFHDDTVVDFGAPTELLDKLIRLEGYLERTTSQNCKTLIVSTNPISHKDCSSVPSQTSNG